MKQSILTFIPQRFRLGSGYASVGKFRRCEITGMALSLYSERDSGYSHVDFPEKLTRDHVAMLDIIVDGFPYTVVNVLGRLSIADFDSFLDRWLAWSNQLQNSLTTKTPCLAWLAASSTPTKTWVLENGFWSAISFAEEAPEVVQPAGLLDHKGNSSIGSLR